MHTLNHSRTGAPEQAFSGPSVNPNHLRKSAVSDLCEKFKISRPSAYRHLQRGTTPATVRHVGNDGKRYPAGKGRHQSRYSAERDLNLAHRALTRVTSHGTPFSEAERNILFAILGIANDLLD